MKIFYEIYIPEQIFESSDRDNHFESLSERLAKILLVNMFCTTDNEIVRGNAERKEPDYIYANNGYEVTLSMKTEFIQQLKGIKPFGDTVSYTENQLIEGIRCAVRRKAKKIYSVPTTLIAISLYPNMIWEMDIPWQEPTSLNDYIEALHSMMSNLLQQSRNQFFEELYDEYIATNKFQDIYIVILTQDKGYLLFRIKDFADGCRYSAKFGITNNPLLPYCIVTSVEKGDILKTESLYNIKYAVRNVRSRK